MRRKHIFKCTFVLIVITQAIGQTILKRSKRFLWLSKDRKLILPPGSTLIITPKLQIPFIRQPPEGLNSDIQISWPFYMFFDKLGMTEDSHPWPPPFFPFSDLFPPRNRNGTDTKKNDPVRPKRAVLSLPPPDNIHGGERAVILPQLEKILNSIGMDGRPCLLRAVCEVHEYPLTAGYGLFGEILTLLFSISSSSYAESHLPEYLKAERKGRAGECSSYFKGCKKSMFIWEERNKYTREMQSVRHTDSNYFNSVEDEEGDYHSGINDLESYQAKN